MTIRKTRILEHGDQVIDRVAVLLRAQTIDAPYKMLVGAIGVGFFVGGGMWRPVARALLGWGAQLAIGYAGTPSSRA